MSLDVYLSDSTRCPNCGHETEPEHEVFSAIITHNLYRMADAACFGEFIWSPEDHGVTLARELIPHLRKGLERLKAKPDYFAQFNPSNGWGSYKEFVPWVEEYLAACEAHPDAKVRVSR